MLSRRVIPCLDIRDGRVVKGVRFANLRDSGDPAVLAERYADQGADEIVLLDVSATPEGRGAALETVRRVRALLAVPLTVGGGVRSVDDVDRLLRAGADKVAINTAAVLRPAIITECAERFGSQCIVAAIDAERCEESPPRWHVRVRSGGDRTALDAVDWAVAVQGGGGRGGCAGAGAGEILLTSWDRDGTRAGYDLDLLRAVAGRVRVPVIASGGAAEPSHMLDAVQAGADAVLAAGIFHDGLHTVQSCKQYLADRGVEVRT
jgi:imidazole glycerol-phosphate synthase subunit HisF